jgi:hypothetical protein
VFRICLGKKSKLVFGCLQGQNYSNLGRGATPKLISLDAILTEIEYGMYFMVKIGGILEYYSLIDLKKLQ